MSCYASTVGGYSRMQKYKKKMLDGTIDAMLVSYQRGGKMNEDLRNGKLLQLNPQSF